MMPSIRELWECGDEVLRRDANYIVTAMAEHPDLVGDQTDALLDQFLEGKQATLASRFKNLPVPIIAFIIHSAFTKS